MSKRIFISFLGTGGYKICNYYWQDKALYIETQYIQEATVKLLYNDWDHEDRIIVFVTAKARETHMNSLLMCLQRAEIKPSVSFIDIRNGFTEEELWENFEIIFNELSQDASLYADITHAFRYLPMLVLVLLNYSKVLKNIRVEKITYGNFEGQETETKMAPINDITALATVQEWATAANDFIRFGNTLKLKDLSEHEGILTNNNKHTKDSTPLGLAMKSLNELMLDIQTCRLKSLYSGTTALAVKENLNKNIDFQYKTLNPLLQKISQRVEQISATDNIQNGFNAVEWCIESGMIQQGFTLLQENIINFLCINTSIDFLDREARTTLGYQLAEIRKGHPVYGLEHIPNIQDISKIYTQLTDIRNDLNHAGMRPNNMKTEKFKEKLPYFIACLKPLIHADQPL